MFFTVYIKNMQHPFDSRCR